MAEVPTNCSTFTTPDGCAVKCTRFCAASDGRQILLFTAYDCETDAFSNQYWDVNAGAFIPPEPLVDCDESDNCDDNRNAEGELFCAESDGRPIILYATYDCVTDSLVHQYWDVSAGAFISAEPVVRCQDIDLQDVFGAGYTFAADPTLRCTTDKVAFTTQLSTSTPALEVGTYRWGLYFEHSQDNASKSMDWRLRLDGVNIETDTASTDDNQLARYETLSKFGTTLVTTPGIKTFDLQFKLTNLTGTFEACMRDARVELWRVA